MDQCITKDVFSLFLPCKKCQGTEGNEFCTICTINARANERCNDKIKELLVENAELRDTKDTVKATVEPGLTVKQVINILYKASQES